MVAVCVFTLAFTVGACAPREQDGRQTVRFFTWKPNQPEVWNEIISMFEKEHPQIRVVREVGPDSSPGCQDLLAQMR